MSVVKLKGITKVYGFGEAATLALDDVSLEIMKGEFVAVMGPSGSGKSTLMNVIGLLDHPTTGSYELSGENVSSFKDKKLAHIRRDKIGFIFQSFNLLPRLSAIENVLLPLVYGSGKVKKLERAAELLERVGLKERQYYMPNQLSGGQVQRVAVARALVNKPSLILADEPTGNLDTHSSKDVMDLLKEINEAGNTIIMITHNPALADYANRIVYMVDGKIVSDEPNDNSDAGVNITKPQSIPKPKKAKKKKKASKS